MLAFTAIAGASAAVGMGAFRRREQSHRERMAGLDINIHVNGIRGKSTVTRMLGGVLRAAGHGTIAKTTGTYACVIDTQAGEHPIRRTGPANINEQYRFLAEWLDRDISALVVECMAVKPKNQLICQNQILRSPITVITNVRLDHQEDMGDTLEEIAASLCRTVPDHGIVVTAEREPALVEIIRAHCEARGSRLIVAEASVASHELVGRFDYRQFEENVAVVLAVGELLDLDPAVVERGMLAAAPDPGTTRITRVVDGAQAPFHWVPMFAVNDWESTVQVFDSVVADNLPAGCRKVIALNNRADRTDRAAMFVDMITTDLAGRYDRVVLYGEIQDVVRRKLIAQGLAAEQIVATDDLDQAQGRELIDRARDGFGDDEVAIFGMVNIHTEHVRSMERYVSAVGAGAAANTAALVDASAQATTAALSAAALSSSDLSTAALSTTALSTSLAALSAVVPATSEDAGTVQRELERAVAQAVAQVLATIPLGASPADAGRDPLGPVTLVEEPVALNVPRRRPMNLYGSKVLSVEPVELAIAPRRSKAAAR